MEPKRLCEIEILELQYRVAILYFKYDYIINHVNVAHSNAFGRPVYSYEPLLLSWILSKTYFKLWIL